MIFLFGFGKKKRKDYVITRSLYREKRDGNRLFDLKQELSPQGKNRIHTTFETPEPFLLNKPLKGGDKEEAKKLMRELTISADQADELVLAKKLKCPLLITPRQLWIEGAAKKVDVKTKVFR